MKFYQCLKCKSAHSGQEWDKTTANELNFTDITSIEEDRTGYFWICPTCKKEIDCEEIQIIESPKLLIFEYKNWKGETGIRKVYPINIWYGHTDFHKEDQWLMKALDIEKNAERDFAINDIIRFIREETK